MHFRGIVALLKSVHLQLKETLFIINVGYSLLNNFSSFLPSLKPIKEAANLI